MFVMIVCQIYLLAIMRGMIFLVLLSEIKEKRNGRDWRENFGYNNSDYKNFYRIKRIKNKEGRRRRR